MGLFQKAVSIVPGQGLLRKSIELIAENKAETSPYLTQEEIDGLLKKRKPSPVSFHRSENAKPPNVPRTWAEAGISAPPLRGPTIDGTEFEKNNTRRKKAPGAADPTDGIISAVFGVPQSIEHPSAAFGILKERLSLRKGALLLYDPLRMVYAPWAGVGYDTTTLHRLRIPLGAGESFNAAANGRPIIVSGTAELAHYAMYFSSREFALVQWLILVPFISGEKLIAILMISMADPPYPDQERFLMGLERIAGAASPAFQKAREERLRLGESAEAAPPRTLEAELTRFLSAKHAAGRKILFFSLSFDSLERKVLAAIPFLDSFRLQEDLRHFLQLFTADTGRLAPAGKCTYVFGIFDLEKHNLDLFLHQLRAYLYGLFGGLDGVLDSLTASSVKKIHSYPDEGDGVAHLVSLFTA